MTNKEKKESEELRRKTKETLKVVLVRNVSPFIAKRVIFYRKNEWRRGGEGEYHEKIQPGIVSTLLKSLIRQH
jgi:hypothetical protein